MKINLSVLTALFIATNPEMRQASERCHAFAGPRMLFKHPYLAIMHFIDEKIIKPAELRKKSLIFCIILFCNRNITEWNIIL